MSHVHMTAHLHVSINVDLLRTKSLEIELKICKNITKLFFWYWFIFWSDLVSYVPVLDSGDPLKPPVSILAINVKLYDI
jgi:hypothetical protein